MINQCEHCRKVGALTLEFVWDKPEANMAYNLYVCQYCGSLARESVWNEPGITWMPIRGEKEKT